MIGNDIIDMADIACHPRFPQRILAESELCYWQSLREPLARSQYLWLSWAAKEAGFKALKRLMPQLRFRPNEFICDRSFESLCWGEHKLSLQYDTADPRRILVVCFMARQGYPFTRLAHQQPANEAEESCLTRRLAIELGEQLQGASLPSPRLSRDEEGLPLLELTADFGARQRAISLSHHGRFQAVTSLVSSSELARLQAQGLLESAK